MQRLNVGLDNEMEVVRGFSKGVNEVTVFQKADGSFVYLNGTPVKELNDLMFLPDPHKSKALDWFYKTYPEKIPRQAKQEVSNDSHMSQV